MSYLQDDQVILSRGAIDKTGARLYRKKANVPNRYVTALQQDLSTLGFTPGSADGIFGNRRKENSLAEEIGIEAVFIEIDHKIGS